LDLVSERQRDKGPVPFVPEAEKDGTKQDLESSSRGIELGLRLLWGVDDMENLGDLIYEMITYEKGD
jgi:hypothetical protein